MLVLKGKEVCCRWQGVHPHPLVLTCLSHGQTYGQPSAPRALPSEGGSPASLSLEPPRYFRWLWRHERSRELLSIDSREQSRDLLLIMDVKSGHVSCRTQTPERNHVTCCWPRTSWSVTWPAADRGRHERSSDLLGDYGRNEPSRELLIIDSLSGHVTNAHQSDVTGGGHGRRWSQAWWWTTSTRRGSVKRETAQKMTSPQCRWANAFPPDSLVSFADCAAPSFRTARRARLYFVTERRVYASWTSGHFHSCWNVFGSL